MSVHIDTYCICVDHFALTWAELFAFLAFHVGVNFYILFKRVKMFWFKYEYLANDDIYTRATNKSKTSHSPSTEAF